MFECTLAQGELFKKIIAALSDLVTEGNFMIDTQQISFQGMDSSHVSLVALSLLSSGFEPYRCDRDITLGINFASLNKILKCMTAKDQLNIRANDDADSVFFTFAAENDKRVSNFELKLMDIDADQLGIPQTEYSTVIKMPSSEFQRICRDLSAIGDSVIISCTKEGVKFSVSGDIGSGDMVLRGRMKRRKRKKQNNEDEEDSDMKDPNNDNNNDNDNDIQIKDEQTPGNDASEDNKNVVTQDIDGDQPMDDAENNVETDKGDKDMQDEEDEYEYEDNADDDEKQQIFIEMNEAVTQTFALRYLNNFTKATSLSSEVTLSMGAAVPLMVEYKVDQLGSLRYYLAPKIDDEE